MNDLVEKVAREMCTKAGWDPDDIMPNDGPRWKYWVPNARAAIAAVAEWLDKDDSGDIDFIKFQLRAAGDGR